jgi:peptide/nickel transport system ATP-binding protein
MAVIEKWHVIKWRIKMIPIVEINHVFMNFPWRGGKTLQANVDVNIQINPGDMIAVVGESGCGKSTIGKICLGTQKPSRGAVFYQGEYIWDPEFEWTTDLRSSVQIVHQDSFASLNPVKTIFDTLNAPLRYYKIVVSRKDSINKITELLESVGLMPSEFFIHKYPFQLSGGQRQRVSIARSTILQPKLIIADEPVSAVDASLRLSIIDLMKNLNKEKNIAFLYITHDLATARYFAKDGKLIVMYLGRMVEVGDIELCLKNPAHPYLQALLKAIPSSDPKRAKDKIDIPLKSFDMPSGSEPPSGCVFHPRCLYSTEICETKIPELEFNETGKRKVACHHKGKLVKTYNG